ncbi:probable G-protein coupled receptor Mth-like 8 [Drosophila tropicalis]|uniref:probable G-protein coupled receptor Mth-like 8 n=1 Tax=Drosophila tropicalis TaxID=46794 RepID=UPI0035AB900C
MSLAMAQQQQQQQPRLMRLFFQLFLFALGHQGTCGYYEEMRYPCAFIDTTNITGSYAMDSSFNGSYIHKWTVIPKEWVAIYDFVIEDGVRIPARRHLRACVCKQTPCVRFCCPDGQIYDLNEKQCRQPHSMGNNLPPAQSHMDIEFNNGSLRHIELRSLYSIHVETPCKHMKALRKNMDYVHWTLHENGTITHRGHMFTKHYCFTPLQLANASWDWQPLACAPEKLHFVLGTREWTYAICLFISIISMFIVLIVYIMCSEMRNSFYGMAIKSYAVCLIFGYALLAYLTLHDPANISKAGCRIIPSLALMHLLLSFYILSFISFKLYLSFHGVVLTKLMFWLIFTPIAFIAVGWSCFVCFSYHGSKLVFGAETCWFDPRNWSVMVYFFAPIFIACAISGFFYVLSLIYLSEQPEIEAEKNFESIEKNRFKSFWKFFGYTALAWFVCVCSFAFNYYRGERSHLNYAVCICMAFHGFAALYALIGKNQQIQNFLRRIEENNDDEISVPMSSF